MNARSHDPENSATEVGRLFDAAVTKIRRGEHDGVADLIDAARGVRENDDITIGVLDAARRLAQTWGKLREETAQRERAIAHSKAHATELAAELVRILAIAHANVTRSPQRGESDALGTAGAPTAVDGDGGATRAVCSGALAPLRVTVLGPFRVVVGDQAIDDWPNGKTKAIFKYLLLNRHRPIAKEALMELFWPDLDPEAARNNLNVAIHRLRRTLARGATDPSFVVFADGHYVLNPRLNVRTDADDFLEHLHRAHTLETEQQADEASQALAAGVELYRAELLAEDRYDAWIEPLRQQFRDAYLDGLSRLCRHHMLRGRYSTCTALSAKILAVDGCNEEAHRTLMRCYARMSQPHLATQQYQSCVRTLARELGLSPSTETVSLYREIAQRELM
jgi:DNA-binding SARP family transcriptional activator